jgi:hypothetical protein
MLTIHGVAVTTRGAAAATIRDVAAMIRGAAVVKVPQRRSLRLSPFFDSWHYELSLRRALYTFIRPRLRQQNRRKR